ncbi:MAG: DUF1109 domain-containing protein [Sphingomicrobium sp.]
MKTDDLIRTLGAAVRPVVPGASAWRIFAALLTGGFLGLLGMDAVFGSPLRAVSQTGVAVFAIKLAYAVAMTAISASLVLIAGRPGERIGLRYAWLLMPPAVVGVAAAMEISGAGEETRGALVLGTTWQTCLTGVVVMSVPVFAALLWAFRRLAPTRLSLAGFMAGVSSGATASLVYALYCPETTASFMLLWYTLGMLMPGLVGAVLGPRLLRG